MVADVGNLIFHRRVRLLILSLSGPRKHREACTMVRLLLKQAIVAEDGYHQ